MKPDRPQLGLHSPLYDDQHWDFPEHLAPIIKVLRQCDAGWNHYSDEPATPAKLIGLAQELFDVTAGR